MHAVNSLRRKAHQNNCYGNIYGKESGKIRHGCERVTKAEMSGRVRLHHRSFLEFLKDL